MRFADAMLAAGNRVGDPVWRMPFWAGYEANLDSAVADMNNVSRAPFAGSVTAALFLRRFVRQARRFAHFDIYGWRPAAKPLGPKGGELQAARAVFEVLRARTPAEGEHGANAAPSIRAAMPIATTSPPSPCAARSRRRATRRARCARSCTPARPLRGAPDARASWTTEALFGELVTVYERARRLGLGAARARRLRRLRAAQARSPPQVRQADAQGDGARHLPLSRRPTSRPPVDAAQHERVAGDGRGGPTFARLADGRFVPIRHIIERERFATDFVAVAERFVGVPYLWGGKTRLGVDCSGLVQVALQAAGHVCPRDSDMQQAEIGEAVSASRTSTDLQRGDLVFWKGHVGIMIDAFRLLHANAHHMVVAIEPLAGAVDRIARTGARVTSVKRIGAAALRSV